MNLTSKAEHVVSKVFRLGKGFGQPAQLPKPETVVVDYSSVNIGKPIHIGHLRATLTGHFVRRMNEFMGHKVIGINYLGDWGTQFGHLIHGFERFGDYKKLEENRTKHLFEVYVKAWKQNVRTADKSFSNRAQILTRYLEEGDEKYLKLWNDFKKITLEDLEKTYERMGVDFTEYEFESQYVESSKELVKKMVAEKLAWIEEDGAVVCKGHLDQIVTLLTKNKSSLYMSREIAAAVHRKEKHQFDRMHYIVSEQQTGHFKNLEHILRTMGYDWMDRCQPWGIHIPFGNIRDMMTRTGKVIFLGEFLDHYASLMVKRLEGNTRLTNEAEIIDVTNKLAWSVLVELNFRLPRMRPVRTSHYDVKMGVEIQYCHVRLCSLEAVAASHGLKPNWCENDTDVLSEALYCQPLIVILDRFENIIQHTYDTLDPAPLMRYLKRLCKLTGSAIYRFPIIKCEDKITAENRLALLMASRQVIRNCAHLMGIMLVEKM